MNCPSPITFDTRAGIRHLAMLGVVQVGVVWREDAGRDDAWWYVTLPDVTQRVRYAPTLDIAKERLANAVRDWVEAACLVPAPSNDNGVRHER